MLASDPAVIYSKLKRPLPPSFDSGEPVEQWVRVSEERPEDGPTSGKSLLPSWSMYALSNI